MSRYSHEEVKEHLRRWVEALRSGDYAQGRGYLKARADGEAPARYCCLGVACALAAEDDPDINVTPRRLSGGGTFAYDDDDQTLPTSVMLWLGSHSSCPQSNGETLTELNDTEEWSFEEIADRIERYGLD